MLPDRVSNPGPLTCESGVLPIALCGPATTVDRHPKVFLAKFIFPGVEKTTKTATK